eukprot:tig00020710_g13386.t1
MEIADEGIRLVWALDDSGAWPFWPAVLCAPALVAQLQASGTLKAGKEGRVVVAYCGEQESSIYGYAAKVKNFEDHPELRNQKISSKSLARKFAVAVAEADAALRDGSAQHAPPQPPPQPQLPQEPPRPAEARPAREAPAAVERRAAHDVKSEGEEERVEKAARPVVSAVQRRAPRPGSTAPVPVTVVARPAVVAVSAQPVTPRAAAAAAAASAAAVAVVGRPRAAVAVAPRLPCRPCRPSFPARLGQRPRPPSSVVPGPAAPADGPARGRGAQGETAAACPAVPSSFGRRRARRRAALTRPVRRQLAPAGLRGQGECLSPASPSSTSLATPRGARPSPPSLPRRPRRPRPPCSWPYVALDGAARCRPFIPREERHWAGRGAAAQLEALLAQLRRDASSVPLESLQATAASAGFELSEARPAGGGGAQASSPSLSAARAAIERQRAECAADVNAFFDEAEAAALAALRERRAALLADADELAAARLRACTAAHELSAAPAYPGPFLVPAPEARPAAFAVPPPLRHLLRSYGAVLLAPPGLRQAPAAPPA